MLNHNFLQSPSYASFHQFLLGRIISEKEILSQEPKIPFCRLNTSAQLPYSVRRPVRNGFVLNNRNTIDINCALKRLQPLHYCSGRHVRLLVIVNLSLPSKQRSLSQLGAFVEDMLTIAIILNMTHPP